MKFEVSLQPTDAVEKLGKPNTLINIVTRFHKLRLNCAPNRNF